MQERENLAYEGDSPKINKRLAAHSKIFRKRVYKTAGQVYTAVGYSIETPVMVEGVDGVIIIDPCEAHGAMVEIMEEFRKITSKPVRAVVYTHHHPDHWAGVGACTTKEAAEKGECMIIAHKSFEYGVAKMTGMLADIKVGRAMYMYGYLLPEGEEGRVNLGLGPLMRKDTQTMIPPNKLVDDKLRLCVCGVELEICHIPSECSDEICVWMPGLKVLHVAECIQGENFPNLYSIRGSNRDPLAWIRSIDRMRKFPAEYLVGNHMRPVEGVAECARHLLDYRDLIQYTHDQAVRLINKGYTPDNLVKSLDKLPPHLYRRERMGEHYGTFMQGLKLVYAQDVGWFTGDAAALDPLPPNEGASRYVTLIGRERILSEGKQALAQGEFQWACELLTLLVRSNHEDMEARHLKAQALRELGYATENGPFRNWYLTQALNLDGLFEEVKKEAPEFNGPEVYFEALTRVPPKYLWDCLKVKLNGPKAACVQIGLTVRIVDEKVANDLEIRRGVLEVHEAGAFPTVGEISLDKLSYLQLFTKLKTPGQLMEEGKLSSCLPVSEVQGFFDYFDGFTPLFDMEFPFE